MLDIDALAPIPLDADTRPATHRRATPHPSLGGYRVTDLSTVVGALLWVALTAAAVTGNVPLSVVELFVCLAVLVFVPLGLGLARTPRQSGGDPLLYRLVVAGQLPAALSVVGALALPVGSVGSIALTLPWLAETGTIGLYGLWRLLSRRRLRPLPELAVDAALLYVPVGAVALVLHRADITFFFAPLIILLTVVHYHYAGFVLPLVTGLVGRVIAGPDGHFGDDLIGRTAGVATLVIVVNLALIAVGITFSPLVEVLAVTAFTITVAVFAALVLRYVVPAVERPASILLGTAALSIFLTMALALAYGYSAFPATGRLITIGEMIRYHGSLNAVGFALPALLAFRLRER